MAPEVFSKLKGMLAKKGSGSVLGIEISSSSIKVVQVRRERGQAALETYGELALGPYAGIEAGKAVRLSDDKMAEALQDLMREAQVTTRDCGVAIPLGSSLVNIIKMPDLGEKRLKEMVPLEMRKFVPVSITEVLLDWRVIPNSEERLATFSIEGSEHNERQKNVDVLVVAIHKDTISRYQSIIEKAELAPTFFEVEVFSTIRSSLDAGLASVMIIDMGSATTAMYITEHRVLRQSHSMNRGSQDITLALSRSLGVDSKRAEGLKKQYGLSTTAPDASVREVSGLVLDSIFSEAHRVLLNYQKRFHRTVDAVILSGGGAGIAGIREFAQEKLETEVTIAHPFGKLVAPAFLEGVLHEAGPEFAVAVGVALRKLEELG